MSKLYKLNKLIQRHTDLSNMVSPLLSGKFRFARLLPDDPSGGGADASDAGDSGADNGLPEGEDQSQGSLLDVAGLVNQDGTFVDAWYDSETLPEEIRGNESLKVMKSLDNLAKSYVNTKSMVGKNKVSLPTGDASDEEVAAFWEAVGSANPALARPSTADGYTAIVPEDLAEVFTQDLMDTEKAAAYAMGITDAQFSKYMENRIITYQESVAKAEADAQRQHDENVLALKKEWGEAYPERQHVVKRLISEAFAGSKEQELAFLQKYAGDPDFVRFAANVGVKMVESSAMIADLTQQTPKEALQKISELKATPGYLSPSSDMTDEQRSAITRQIQEQYQLAYPETK